jgi:hypothetical protein
MAGSEGERSRAGEPCQQRAARTCPQAVAGQKQASLGRLVAGQCGQNAIKPKLVEAILMSEMAQNQAEQTHREHPSIFQ